VTPLGPLASPVFTPESGTYELSEIVTIEASAGATIYYGVGTTKEEATEVYAEEFKLATLGEVTYVAYAKKGDRESDIVTVTYNVVKNDVEFAFEQSEYTVKMGTMPSELPVPSAKLNYTLTSSNTSVASLDPVIGAELWLLAPGDTEITATYAGNETTNPATAKYTLHVIEEGVPAVDASVTFKFTDVSEEKYGLENAELEIRSNQTYFKSGATAKNGDVTIILNKKDNTNGWRILNDKDLRIYTNSEANMTISVGSGIITSVDFDEANSGTITKYTVNGGAEVTPKVMSKFTVDCTGLNTGTIIFTPTVGKNGAIGNVTVHYTIPAIPAAHTSANLAMEGEREVLAGDLTTIEGAVVATDVDQNVVNYLILNEEAALMDDEFIISNETGNDISVLTEAELGEYRLVAYIEPSDVYYPAIVEVPLYVREVIMPAELYLHGHFFNRYYDLTAPVKMEKKGRDFVATDILIGGNPEHTGDAYDYVFTTHKLDRAAAESSMMRAAAAAGSHQWDVLTEGTVYHNENEGALTATAASDVTSAADITPINAGKEGLYQITVNFDDPKTPTYKAVFTDITTGIEGVTVDKNAEAVYYDLIGRRVANPSAGVFIRVQGGKAEKIMIK
ncbi:MAG: chitobiase/beta-hexosaminidase C-terminal domain-containing protein, partial [Muribaculaceae bacterium]|nr:chitobiase/beta-hexosaminidase C-terminal domain-containing protein [Muribaculaceae bacterium]